MNRNMCYNCGGELFERDGRWICAHCGSYMPEQISSEEVMLLTSACQKLRLADFFDAEQEFEDIIRRHPKNAQGYWGHLLARYGIKYEEDYDGSRIPTCYAASMESVYDSSDYKKAMEYADEENRAVFKEHAAYIERVRREWVEKASKEPPYDIFISYKDSDREHGIKRTQDSVTMQDLYVQLKDRGYRVFFSHESLRNKTGEKYEPYIYGALSTAKIMLVYGSRPDYINATWVKNEWTRYKKRMQAGEKKQGSLLVAYEGFAPMELPSALSSLQCLDAGEKRFYTDLFAAVERILKEDDGEEQGSAAQDAALEGNLCSHEPMTIPAKAPTCTEDGRTEGTVCILCGKMLKKAQILPATGHSFGAWHIVKKATCTEDGEHESVCRCGERKTKKIPARGEHIPGDWETAIAPAPGKEGLKVKKCLLCGMRIEEEKLPALPEEKAEPAKSGVQSTAVCAPTVHESTVPVSSRAHLSSQGLKYKENSDGKTCKITGTGACHDTELVIPETIGGYRVTGIGGYAFLGKDSLVSVTLPRSVTSIGMLAFRGCTSLKTVYYKGTKAEWERMKPSENWWGESAIAEIRCIGTDTPTTSAPVQEKEPPKLFRYLVNADGRSCKISARNTIIDQQVQIPSKMGGYPVKDICPYAFRGFKYIESVTIPYPVMRIGDFAFYECSKLKSVSMSPSITEIGISAFGACASLTDLTLGNSVKSIGEKAFSGCKKLTAIRYNGTKKEWQKISLGKDWRTHCAIKRIECTDGTIKFLF